MELGGLPVLLEEGFEERPVGLIRGDVCNTPTAVRNQRAAEVGDLLGRKASMCLLEVPAPDMECHVLRMGDSKSEKLHKEMWIDGSLVIESIREFCLGPITYIHTVLIFPLPSQ